MNIFVIEDEPPILREIIAVIQSFDENYKIIGKAQNGQEAMDFLTASGELVDVMITDIQIPVLSGLDLIAYTHQHLPHILCIILTGFSSFDYAHKAIRYNVFDYLLKPIDENELHRQLKKAYAQKCVDYIRNRPEDTPEDSIDKPRTDTGCQLALLSLGSFPMFASLYNELFPELWKELDLHALFEKYPDLQENYWIIDGLTLGEKIILYMVPDTCDSTCVKSLPNLLEPLLAGPPVITMAVDTRFLGIRNIHQSILDLRSFINRQARLETSQLLFYTKENLTPAPEPDYQKFHSYCQRLSSLFVQKSVPLFEAELKNYVKAIQSDNLTTACVYRLLQDLFHSCLQAVDDTLAEPQLNIQYTVGDVLMLSDSYKALTDNLLSIFASLFENMLKLESVPRERSKILLKIDTYMKEHFTEPISTKSVAELFGFTPAYLSKIFREYKSVTPADYIIGLRINKAKELLRADSKCKIKEIAAFVGYEDSLYFSKVFKKATGMSPRQFIEDTL
ncbi:MAG: AraC family transcriptional regulator [Eubacteriales bacterium]|nr:AraC family transcriptional regulator [Eubacteriales bacterium]